MQRITQKNLDNLAAAISKDAGREYEAGQIFGAYYSFTIRANNYELFNARTKSALFDLMGAFYKGLLTGKGV